MAATVAAQKKDIYAVETLREVKERMAQLRPESQRL